ncbi:hypothetical protein CRYUN_Cryun40dG0045200 [Craigia yunnanensis]
MSAQESSFVTLVQRLFANPPKIRMHYGHPDVFDRFWFMTRGGLSKASKVINISEYIFAGFNCTLRGGSVTHHEYIQVGKGRDLGLNQISKFEAKIACGNGEQVLSRDVYSGVENSVLGNDSSSKNALSAVINQELVIQFGLFTTLPAVMESSVENGFFEAIWEFVMMQLQLSIVFYTFSMGTRAHFFGRTILHGGAKYLATGLNFVVQHTSFAENYRLYARSHFIKAIELGLILTTVNDFDDFMKWIWYRGGVIAKSNQSWERWWYEEQYHLRTTSLWGKLLEIVLNLRFFFFEYGIVYHMGIAGDGVSVYVLSWIYIFVAFGIYLTVSYVRDKYGAKGRMYFRLAQSLLIILGILFIIALLELTAFKVVDLFTSLLALLPTGWGLVSIAQVFRPLLQHTKLWDSVVSVARLYDILFGVIVMPPVAFFSWMPGFQSMQTRILFNAAFSKGLQMFKIITEKIHQKDV